MQLASCPHEGTSESVSGRDESVWRFDHQSSGSIEHPRVANLFEEEKSDKPSDDGETGRDSAGEEVRVLLQELVFAEQVVESLRWARKCSSDHGSVSNGQVESNILSNRLRVGRGHSPYNNTGRPRDGFV